jgi:hypothetical protein
MGGDIGDRLNEDIETLNEIIDEMTNTLNSDPNLTPEERTTLTAKITQLANMRSNLYTSLSDINQLQSETLALSIDTLEQQAAAMGILEGETKLSQEELNHLKNEMNNKIRLIEINKYYGEKYSERVYLMKIVIYTLIPVIILTILFNKNILPSALYYGLVGIIGIIGAIFFWKTVLSISSRSNMNYDSYNWPFDKNAMTQKTKTTESSEESSSSQEQCVGEECCAEDQTYDYANSMCITTITDEEGFQTLQPKYSKNKRNKDDLIHKALTKTQPGKYKADVNLATNIKPYNM